MQNSLRVSTSLVLSVFAALCVVGIVDTVGAQGVSDSQRRAQATAEENAEKQRYDASRTALFAPFVPVRARDRVQLILVSSVNEAVEVDLAVFDVKGNLFPLGQYTVPPSRHTSLDLHGLIRDSAPSFQRGSLRVEYVGTPETLQAWILIRGGEQWTELPLLATSEVGGRSLLTFWGQDAALFGAMPSVYLVNAGPRPIDYSVVASSRAKILGSADGTIEPGHQHRIRPLLSPKPGWFKVEHDGEPGDLMGVAIQEFGNNLSVLPLWALPLGNTTIQEAVHVPFFFYADSSVASEGTFLSVLNQGKEEASVAIFALGSSSEVQLFEASLSLKSGEVRTVPVTVAVPETGTSEVPGRLRVIADRPGVLVQGRSVSRSGEVVELSFIDHNSVHSSGSYPLLPTNHFATELTLVNLGEDSAEVVGQFYWDGGTYALGPVVVEAKSVIGLSVDTLIADAGPDIRGRSLMPSMPNALLKWTVHSGSRSLLGRTEARPRDSSDRVGFNCLGCCWETPWGSVEPSYVSFEPGQSVGFESCVNYSTCNGEMGPYWVSPSSKFVPSPFTWDAVQVSASDAAQEDLSFFAWGEEVYSTCEVFDVPYDGIGTADTCKLLLRKAHNPAEKWSTSQACTSQASNCSQCNNCCEAQKAYWLCKKKNSDIVQHEYEVCIGHCLTDHCS